MYEKRRKVKRTGPNNLGRVGNGEMLIMVVKK